MDLVRRIAELEELLNEKEIEIEELQDTIFYLKEERTELMFKHSDEIEGLKQEVKRLFL